MKDDSWLQDDPKFALVQTLSEKRKRVQGERKVHSERRAWRKNGRRGRRRA